MFEQRVSTQPLSSSGGRSSVDWDIAVREPRKATLQEWPLRVTLDSLLLNTPKRRSSIHGSMHAGKQTTFGYKWRESNNSFRNFTSSFEEYNFDAFRIYKLDETGVSAGRDDRGTKRGQEVLLLFDGHRSHMLVRVLQHLSENGVRCMATQ